MKKTQLTGFGTMLLIAVSALTASATPIATTDPQGTVVIQGQARNGRSGFEGILFTPGPDPNMNPLGAPVWLFGTLYNFALEYTAATGTAKWSIDFNRDSDFLDASESVSQANASLIGQTFKYVNLYAQGNALGNTTVSSFTINGTTFSSPIPTTSDNVQQQLYKDSTGQFGAGDILATGSFSFSANGNSDERPRLWVQLSEQQTVSASVPDGGATVGLLGFAFLGLGALRRKFRV